MEPVSQGMVSSLHSCCIQASASFKTVASRLSRWPGSCFAEWLAPEGPPLEMVPRLVFAPSAAGMPLREVLCGRRKSITVKTELDSGSAPEVPLVPLSLPPLRSLERSHTR